MHDQVNLWLAVTSYEIARFTINLGDDKKIKGFCDCWRLIGNEAPVRNGTTSDEFSEGQLSAK